MTPFALNAGSPLRFPLSREKTVPYTAASALPPAADEIGNNPTETAGNPEEQIAFPGFLLYNENIEKGGETDDPAGTVYEG
jgi:hypothetical protein